MVMSETGGLAMHQLPMHHRGLVQPSLVMNPHPLTDSCSVESQNKKNRRTSHCVGCGGQIHDQYILRVAPDLEWHAACLKCQECQRFLDESCTCFVRDGKTYCKVDYVRLFGTKCDKCGLSFSKSDFVMRAKSKIYHIDCFRCRACARQLVPGDEFALRDGGILYCKEDHDAMEKTSTPSMGHTPGAESNNNTSLSNNNHNSNSTELGCMSDSGSESGSHKGGNGVRKSGSGTGTTGGTGSDGKPTRVRTVLNEKQLHTLRTCYAANPRPDALMKEQLVEMTSLSPRVIRVWFQNKRCKDKKKTLAMKQQMQQEKDGRKMGYGAMQGIPMVASSPVRHDSPIGVHPLEVQAYQPPWKALSDFALHADLEQPHQPAFQHLVNQMHGYDLPPPAMGPSPGGGPPHPLMGSGGVPVPPPSDSMTHPDSTDSYVTYLDSDESLPASP
ncbi:insulin gene enhancer protein ISL-1 isoform X1 [Diorhabda carinulata]|uniref:insulin gene enhancer protein ISL-1 isoform X2 n=1 Tax=Diorhabda sublineata TaxID=1163346 RepID=UPI0024E08465|nr:insulin gene enhancer protein ISL-1 isoform X2 [Diorhabda sublineata]XP_057667376.1 insulin gene enhancer protein ISL-1 isoform X1 [Diorhabda carinulata]